MPPQAEGIKVAVRVRPFNQREKDLQSVCVVSMSGQNTIVSSQPPKTFTYDFSYWSHEPGDNFVDQEKVQQDIGNVILENALNGFNGCLFAYGQTGSGKSYSVMGYKDAPGIIPRSVDKIFEEKTRIETGDVELRIWISYVEIYNEHVRDLLHAGNDPPELKVQDHPKLGVYIPGLTESACTAPDDVQKLMDFGTKKRVVAATQMNATSSRSHAVFTVKVQHLEGSPPDPGAKDERKHLNAKINLVDLAGSERQSKTGTEGAQLKEGCAINQSLSALGLVIKDLSEAHSKKGGGESTVPFRSSKLTFLLKDSLAGNSKTYMIAAISPASDNTEETISTLRFASSVKKIKTVAVQNKDKKDEMIESLQDEIKRLKAGGAVAAEGGDNEAQIAERKRLIDEMKSSYETQIEHAKQMDDLRDQALADGGLSNDEINKAFGVDSKTPYMLNMADDPMLAGCLLYFLAEGIPTTIGSASDNKIQLKGIGIPATLCVIDNVDNNQLTLRKLGSQGRVNVNGRLVSDDGSETLNHNDKLYLGRAYALKLTVPLLAAIHGDDEVGLSLEGLEDEWSALDDSPSWGNIQMHLDEALRQMPRQQATGLFDDVRNGCKLCDEANEISEECRPQDGFCFEVDLMSSASVVVRVLFAPEGDPRLLYVWPLSSMQKRLERMRDCHETYVRKGVCEIDVLVDPWHEADAADVGSRLTELEIALEDARTELQIFKNKKQHATRKSFVIWQQGQDSSLIRSAFQEWSSFTADRKKVREKSPPKRSIALSKQSPAPGSARAKSALRNRPISAKATAESTAKAGTPAPEPAAKAEVASKAEPVSKARASSARATARSPAKVGAKASSPTPPPAKQQAAVKAAPAAKETPNKAQLDGVPSWQEAPQATNDSNGVKEAWTNGTDVTKAQTAMQAESSQNSALQEQVRSLEETIREKDRQLGLLLTQVRASQQAQMEIAQILQSNKDALVSIHTNVARTQQAQ